MSPGASRGGPRCEEQDGDGGVEVLAAPAMRLLLPERCKHVVPINDGLVLAGGHPKVYHMDLTTSEVMEVDTLGDDIVDMCHVSGSGHLVAMGMSRGMFYFSLLYFSPVHRLVGRWLCLRGISEHALSKSGF